MLLLEPAEFKMHAQTATCVPCSPVICTSLPVPQSSVSHSPPLLGVYWHLWQSSAFEPCWFYTGCPVAWFLYCNPSLQVWSIFFCFSPWPFKKLVSNVLINAAPHPGEYIGEGGGWTHFTSRFLIHSLTLQKLFKGKVPFRLLLQSQAVQIHPLPGRAHPSMVAVWSINHSVSTQYSS